VIPSNNHVGCNYVRLQVLKLGVVFLGRNGTCDLFLFLSLKFISQSCEFSSSFVWLFVWMIEVYQLIVWTLQSRSGKCNQVFQSQIYIVLLDLFNNAKELNVATRFHILLYFVKIHLFL
jgi:hypothetical protein